nr:hypothetical protein [Tanacetum cinerariifolium]
MDASGGSGSNSPIWPIVDDNGAMDINGTMVNLEERIANLKMVFAYLKNKKMLERQENKPKKEFEVASKSTSSTSNPNRSLFECDFVSLDLGLESRKSAIDNSFTLGSNEEAYHVNILQSCNGLLVYSGWGSPAFYYVYNPSTNLFKRLPQPDNSHDVSILYATGVLRMAFDPTKSRDYKVVQLFACLHDELEIQVYFLETEN